MSARSITLCNSRTFPRPGIGFQQTLVLIRKLFKAAPHALREAPDEGFREEVVYTIGIPNCPSLSRYLRALCGTARGL